VPCSSDDLFTARVKMRSSRPTTFTVAALGDRGNIRAHGDMRLESGPHRPS